MNSGEILYGNPNDERYTPDYGVVPILKYIPQNWKVWCPFDTEESEFVKLFREYGYNIVHSHIATGQDFYKWSPDSFDCIVSNPPFKGKRQIFERALSFGKPFALLMTLTWLNDSAPKILFRDKDLQLLMFEQRMEFKNVSKDRAITFSSAYYCWNLLPKQIIMERLGEPYGNGIFD